MLPWSLGTKRPLSTLEMSLHISMANVATSASFVKLSWEHNFLFCSPSKTSPTKSPPLQGSAIAKSHATRNLAGELLRESTEAQDHTPQGTLSLTSFTANRHKDPSRVLALPLPYVTQPAMDWQAHDDPVYGFTDTSYDYRAEIETIRATSAAGYKLSTTGVEKGHHKKWLAFCQRRGLRAIRDDHEANSGLNRAGFQREIDIMAAFMLEVFKTMSSRGHRKQALPSSAANVVRGVRRIHLKYVPPITMVPFAHVASVLKGMNALYLREHGYRMLLRKRAEPWRKAHLARFFKLRTQLGTSVAGYIVAHTIFWVSYFACCETMASTGSRKSEMVTAGLWRGTECLSRASLVWVIAGVPVHCPTRAQLDSLTEDDYAVLMPPPSKTDQFGVIWGDKPMYLPVRFTTSYCAALRLRELELLYPVPAEERENTPLFCMEPGVPFTHNVMTKLLVAIKDIIMPEIDDKSVFTYHSFRVLLATQLGCSGRTGPEIQALCRWQSPESLAIYVRLQPREAISMLDAAQNATITSYSTVNLPCFKASHLSDAISVQCGNDGDKDRNGTFALT